MSNIRCASAKLTCVGIALLNGWVMCASAPLEAADRPNVLIVMADDCTFNDLPMYGGTNAQTPNLDRFAQQSLVFNRAYLCSAMCQPCRAELYSGQYPMQNGCAWNHAASRDTTTSLPNYLEKTGYRVGLAGKVHVLPESAFAFESIDGFDKSCTRNPTQSHDIARVREFMMRDTKQPFCLVVALVEPHVPWVMGDASQYPPAQVQLPPNLADTERTREDYSKYLAEITYMDGQFGELLQVLELSGKAAQTLVLFTSEQGSQFPGCKWTNWDTGVHTALMARWPGRIEAGQRTDALVQYADVAPTLIEACGGQTSDWQLDGHSFLHVLEGSGDSTREFVYGMHNNYPEGPPFPIRSITDGKLHYIRNLTPDEIYIEKHLMGKTGDGVLNNPYWSTWIWEASQNPHTYDMVKRYTHRPAEQLYDLSNDRYEMTNLANDPKLATRKQQLADELDRWMQSQGDPGVAQDTVQSHQAAKRGNHRFAPPESSNSVSR